MSVLTLLVPHNENLSLVPVLMYWTLFHTVGLTYWPYRLMIALAEVIVAALTLPIFARALNGKLRAVAHR